MYVLHYQNLQIYLTSKLKLKQITSCISNQSQWLKLYVEFNMKK